MPQQLRENIFRRAGPWYVYYRVGITHLFKEFREISMFTDPDLILIGTIYNVSVNWFEVADIFYKGKHQHRVSNFEGLPRKDSIWLNTLKLFLALN